MGKTILFTLLAAAVLGIAGGGLWAGLTLRSGLAAASNALQEASALENAFRSALTKGLPGLHPSR